MCKRIGIKSGKFSLGICHSGYIEMFKFCKQNCDYLIVLTNDDSYIYNKKQCVPVPLKDRLEILKSIRYIDEVGTFTQATEELWIKDYKERRIVPEHGKNSKLIVFHSPEVENSPPAHSIADEIIYCSLINKDFNSVSRIFKSIKEAK